MIKIKELSLLDIAAKSTLSDKNTKWIYESIDYALRNEYLKVFDKFYASLDKLDSKELDYLLWEYHADYVDIDLNNTEKVNLVKQSIQSHFHKGTVGSVKKLVDVIFGNGDIKEWFEYSGRPGYFRVITSGDLSSPTQYNNIIKMINEYKNERSWLEGLNLIRNTNTLVFVGQINKNKTTYTLNCTDITIPNEDTNMYTGQINRTRYLVTTK